MRTITLITLLFSVSNLIAQNEESFIHSDDFTLEEFLAKEVSSPTNFQANINYAQESVQLTWESTPATKSDYFIIQKSKDKNTWETVAIIFGSPHTSRFTNYLHTDYRLSEDISYYRLKQITQQGEAVFSNISPIKYIKTKNNIAGINLSPSITDIHTNIAYEEIFDKEILLVVRDKKGKEFYSKALLNLEEEAIVAVPIEKEIPSGEYLITASSENQIYSQNIIIK